MTAAPSTKPRKRVFYLDLVRALAAVLVVITHFNNPYLHQAQKRHVFAYEPFGIYAGKSKDLKNLPDGAKIAVPNDVTNEARALLLLADQGLITLKDNTDINATKQDIVENPHNIEIVEVEAAQVPRSLQDVDFGVVNGNFAIASGLKVTDALATEAADSVAAKTYANIVVVREGDENSEKTQALVKALTTAEIKQFIENKYQGAVVPIF